MTIPIKTRCPNCGLCFNLPKALLEVLDHTDTEVRCAGCQCTFLVNDYLVVSANEQTGKPATYNSQALKINKPSTVETNSFDKIVADFGSDFTPKDSVKTSKSMNHHSASTSLPNADYANNTAFEATASNNWSATALNPSEDTWLEEMLKAQNDTAALSHTELKTHEGLFDSILVEQDFINRQILKHKPVSDIKARQALPKSPIKVPIDTILWIVGCLVLTLLLFAQYVIFNLNTLMKNPAYAANLQSLCQVAVCSLPAADIFAFNVDNITHRPSQIQSAQAFSDIQGTLVNADAKSQILPNLKVSIYTNDKLVGEFIALPEDYLLSYQNQLGAHYSKPFMFTVPIANKKISKVTIDTLY